MLENEIQRSFINDEASKARKKLVIFSIACVLVAVFGLDQASILSQSFTPTRNEALLPYVGIVAILWLKFEFMSKFLDYNADIDTLIRSSAFKVNGRILSLAVYLKSLFPMIKSRYHDEYYAAAQAKLIEQLSQQDVTSVEAKISKSPQVVRNTETYYTVVAQIISERKASVYFIEYTFPMIIAWAGMLGMVYVTW